MIQFAPAMRSTVRTVRTVDRIVKPWKSLILVV